MAKGKRKEKTDMSEINITPMKVGVIGTGMICRIYIENIAKRFSVVELAAVADRNIERRGKSPISLVCVSVPWMS